MQPERHHENYERVVAAARALPAVRTAIAHPCDDVSLQSVIEAAQIKLIEPILVGPSGKVRAVAEKAAGRHCCQSGPSERFNSEFLLYSERFLIQINVVRLPQG